MPPGVLNVVHGGEDAVNAICDHPDIKAISFVGSTKVGTHVYNRASLNGKRVQCMMGAKNHAIVMPDANKEQTLNALAGAAFGAAGQRCMALSVVVLVGEAQQWIPDLVAKAKTLKVSGGTDKGTDVGPLVSCAAKDRVEGLIERGIADGATLEPGRPQAAGGGLRKRQFRRPHGVQRREARHVHLRPGSLRPGAVPGRSGRHRRGDCLHQRQPERQWHGHLHAVGRGGPQVPGRDRRGPGGHQRADSRARAAVLFLGLARIKLGDLGPYGKQVVLFYTQTKTVTARWFDDSTISHGVNTTISLK